MLQVGAALAWLNAGRALGAKPGHPLDFAEGLEWWFDAELSGYNAGTWEDLSANGADAIQATAGAQPSAATNLRGEAVLRFDGADDVLPLPAFDLSGGWTLAIALQVRDRSDFAGILAASSAAGTDHATGFVLQQAAAVGHELQLYGQSLEPDTLIVKPDDERDVIYLIATQEAGEVEVREASEDLVDTHGGSVATPDELVLGARYASSSGGVFGHSAVDVLTIAMWSRPLAALERGYVEGWLGGRFGRLAAIRRAIAPARLEGLWSTLERVHLVDTGDASEFVGRAMDAPPPVGAWQVLAVHDMSGHGRHMEQAGILRPEWHPSYALFNGLPAIRMQTTDTCRLGWTAAAGWSVPQPLAMVHLCEGSGASGAPSDDWLSEGGQLSVGTSSAGVTNHLEARQVTSKAVSTTEMQAGQIYALSGVFKTPDEMGVRVDGVEEGTMDPFPTYELTFDLSWGNQRAASTSRVWRGALGGFALVSAPDDASLEAATAWLEAYLAGRYGHPI